MNCPNCSAKLEINSEMKVFTCNYCGTTTLLDDESKVVKHISSKLQNIINEIAEYYENGNYNKALSLSEDALEDYPTNKELLNLKNKSQEKIYKLEYEKEMLRQKKLAEIIERNKKISSNIKTSKGFLVTIICTIVIGVLFIIPSLSKPSDEETIKNRVNDLGVTFYEDFYYVSAGNGDADKRTETLSKYTSMGIKVSLENLIRYYVTTDDYKSKFSTILVKEDDKTIEKSFSSTSNPERVESLENEWFNNCNGKNDKCDVDNTKVIYYPQEPYGEKDYKIEVVIETE